MGVYLWSLRLLALASVTVSLSAPVLAQRTLSVAPAQPTEQRVALARSMVDRGPWALLSPLIVLLAWQVHRAGISLARSIVIHAVGVLVALLAAEGAARARYILDQLAHRAREDAGFFFVYCDMHGLNFGFAVAMLCKINTACRCALHAFNQNFHCAIWQF